MNQSSRHHYIPKFLIKKFTDEDGLIYVYDKKENRIIGKKSPKSIFFEWNRNTVNFNGTDLDQLEKLYSELDSKIAVDLDNVLKTKKVTPEELISISVLATILKWRSPISDQEFNEIKEDATAEDLAIEINVKTDSVNIDEDAISHIKNSEIFKETKRVILAIRPFLDERKSLDLFANSFIHTYEKIPAIIGDCPIIEKTNSDFRKIENFIFPISSNTTFIYSNKPEQKITNSLFYMQKDLAVLHLSEKYVACKDKQHLENIVKMYEEIKADNKINLITHLIFDFIE